MTRPTGMRRGAGVAVALAVAVAAATSGPAAGAPRVTVFGDSVQASFGFAPQAPRVLSPGIDLRMEARVCRKLTGPGCLGGNPPSVLAVTEALGPRLGDLVVVNVGYNDAGGYDVERVLRAFGRAGVRAVVWVTLRERAANYRRNNALVRRAAARLSGRPGYPVIRIADWNTASAGRPWFTSDGIHLNGSGAVGLAGVLRRAVVRTFAAIDVRVGGAVAALPARDAGVRHPVRALAGDGDAVWVAGGRRLTRVGDAGGRRSRTRGGDAAVVSDGRRAWLLPRSGAAARTADGRLRVRTGAPATAVAWTGSGTWFAVTCRPADGSVCPEPARLLRFGGGRTAVPLTTVPSGLAGSPDGLWVARPAADGGTVLELRAPRSGRLVRTVPLRGGPVRQVAATRHGALVVSRDGRLRLVSRAGRVRVVMRGVSAVATDARSEVWALQPLRGRVVRLHPRDARVLARAPVGRRPVARTSALAVTREAVWVSRPGARGVARVPRR